ncbi:hypothetical protein [Streptomyces sp. NPDC057702]|uniref:hypothetical protein n=1 Tax=unclassified Streptomyces TaxID=2593676 RepID=UPI0036C14F7E
MDPTVVDEVATFPLLDGGWNATRFVLRLWTQPQVLRAFRDRPSPIPAPVARFAPEVVRADSAPDPTAQAVPPSPVRASSVVNRGAHQEH